MAHVVDCLDISLPVLRSSCCVGFRASASVAVRQYSIA